MSVQTTEETALWNIFPKNNIELFRIVKNKLVVCLRLKRSIQVPCQALVLVNVTQFLAKKTSLHVIWDDFFPIPRVLSGLEP